MPNLTPLDLVAQAQSGTGMREIIDSLARTPLSKVVMLVVALTIVRLIVAPMLAKTPAHRRYGGFAIVRNINEVADAIVYAGVFVFMIIRPFGVQMFLIPSGSMWPTLHVNDFIVANKAIYRYTDPKPGDVVVFRPPAEATAGHPEQIDKDGQVNVDFIKRCIGVPGDVVELRNGVLYRNGVEAPDPTKHYSSSPDDVNYTELSEGEKAQMPKASFKLVNWHGKVIPLNYMGSEANSLDADNPGVHVITGTGYQVHDKFGLKSDGEQAAAIALPAAPVPPGYYLMVGDNRNNSFDGRAWGLVPRDSIIGRSEFIWLPFNRIGTTPPVTAWRTPK